MPDLSGPLFSLSASGTIAKAITYSNWRGIKYARQRVIPTNPKTTDQVKVRTVFSALSELWKTSPSSFYYSYDAATKGKPYTNRNLLVRLNSANLYADGDLSHLAFSAEYGGAPNDGVLTLTPGSGQIACALSDPTPPTDWTVSAVWFAIIEEFDPTTSGPTTPMQIASDASSPYAHTFTGLTSGHTYQVGAWVEYAHGTPTIVAWSPSVNDADAPS